MILLAGGTGTLGRELQRTLRSRGHRARILTRHATTPHDETVVQGDVRDPASLRDAMAGVDTVISAVTGFGLGGGGPRRIDLEGNRNLIEAARACHVPRMILVSMCGARAEHPLELYRAKHAAENALRASGLDWTVVRPMPFLETWVGLIATSVRANGRAMIFGTGRNPVNFVSVRDVAFLIERALSDRSLRGDALDVGGPENVTMTELVDAIGRGTQHAVAVRHVPRGLLRAGAAVARFAKPDVARLMEAAILMDTADMTYDDAMLRKLFPDAPRTYLADVVAEVAAAV